LEKPKTKSSQKYIGLYRALKEPRLSKIFKESDSEIFFTREQLIYLAGFIDHSGSINIMAKWGQRRKFTYYNKLVLQPYLRIKNRSSELSKWIINKIPSAADPDSCEEMEVPSGPKAYLLSKDLFEFLILKKSSAYYLIKFGETHGWSRLNWNKAKDYISRIPKDIERLIKELKIALDLRYDNIEKIGRKWKDTKKIERLYVYLGNGRKYKFIPIKEYIITNYISPLFNSPVKDKWLKREQLIYLAGLIDADISSLGFYFNRGNYYPQIKIKSKSYKLKNYIGKTFGKKASNNPLKFIGKDCILLIKMLYEFLITQKRKANYLLKFDNITYLKDSISLIIDFKKEFPFDKGNALKSNQKLLNVCCISGYTDFAEEIKNEIKLQSLSS